MENEFEEHANKMFGYLEMQTYSIKPFSRCPYSDPLEMHKCKICMRFVSLPDRRSKCPCNCLGEHEAVKRTWIMIEVMGILDDE